VLKGSSPKFRNRSILSLWDDLPRRRDFSVNALEDVSASHREAPYFLTFLTADPRGSEAYSVNGWSRESFPPHITKAEQVASFLGTSWPFLP
jgi:hypothetical protein